MSEFICKVARDKFNTQKSTVFLCTSDEQEEANLKHRFGNRNADAAQEFSWHEERRPGFRPPDRPGPRRDGQRRRGEVLAAGTDGAWTRRGEQGGWYARNSRPASIARPFFRRCGTCTPNPAKRG